MSLMNIVLYKESRSCYGEEGRRNEGIFCPLCREREEDRIRCNHRHITLTTCLCFVSITLVRFRTWNTKQRAEVVHTATDIDIKAPFTTTQQCCNICSFLLVYVPLCQQRIGLQHDAVKIGLAKTTGKQCLCLSLEWRINVTRVTVRWL